MKTGWLITTVMFGLMFAAYIANDFVAWTHAGSAVSMPPAAEEYQSIPERADSSPDFEFEHAADQAAALEALMSGDILPYSQLRKAIEKSLEAKLVGERLRLTNEGWVYEVRARQEHGRMIFAVINARDGQIMRRMEGKYAPADR